MIRLPSTKSINLRFHSLLDNISKLYSKLTTDFVSTNGMSADLSLHKAVFSGDIKAVEQMLNNSNESQINGQDIHGNTALHIATIKGNRSIIELLVKKGADTNVRNVLNWTPTHEAISFGDFEIVKIMAEVELERALRHCKEQQWLELFSGCDKDYILKFDLFRKDYGPVSFELLPYFSITSIKKGLLFKVDVDMSDSIRTHTGDFSLVIDIRQKTVTVAIDRIQGYQTFPLDSLDQIMFRFLKEHVLEEYLNDLFNKSISTVNLSVDTLHQGNPLFRKVISKKVASFRTDVYESKGVDLNLKTRTEHMIARQQMPEPRERSLPAPEPNASVTWDQYIRAPKGKFPNFGRQPNETSKSNRTSIVIGITQQIPLKFDWNWITKSADQVLGYDLSDRIAKQIQSLPEGFPTLIDFPVLKSSNYIKLKLVSFNLADVPQHLLSIPRHYVQRTDIIPTEQTTQ